MPNIEKKHDKKSTKSNQKIKTVPNALLGIRFDDVGAWMAAYRSTNAQLVARAVISAFRKRYFLSQKSAAEKLGISEATYNKWENGLSNIRWKSQNDLVSAGWFKPQHFGLDVDGAEFTEGATHG